MSGFDIGIVVEIAILAILIIVLVCLLLSPKKKEQDNKEYEAKSHRGANITTYVIALICIWAGLLVPLYGTSGTLADKILIMYIPDCLNIVLGKTVFSLNSVQTFSEVYPLTIFGKSVNIYAHLMLIYALIAVVGIIFLFPVIFSKKRKKNSAVFSYIIEEACAVDLSLYAMTTMLVTLTPSWQNYGALIALGGLIIILCLQSIINKGSLGTIKFVLFLLSAIAALALFDITLWIHRLISPIKPFIELIDSSIGFLGALNGFYFFAVYMLNPAEIGNMLSALGDIKQQIQFIAIIAVVTLAVINFVIDLIALSTYSKYNKNGKVKRNKGSKVFGFIRYLLEFVAALLAIIMTFVLKGTIGIYLYLIAVIALIETIIQLIRIIRLAATSREKKVAKQKKHKRNDNFVFTDDVLSGDYQDEIEFVSPQIDEAQPAASKPVYAAAATDGDGFADIWQGDLDAELQDSYNKEEEASAATSEGEDASMQDGPKQEEEQPRTVIYTAKTVYNGPRDAFIDTLADEQKVEFYKVFLEKSRGNLPPVPVYILNGKNESFFQSIFVHLNSFRDLISDGLLDKIYQQVINLR